MLRVIFGIKLEDRTNMTNLRTNIKMFSINQLTCYHVLLEAFKVINYESSDIILKKWLPKEERHYPFSEKRQKEVKVVVPDHVSCRGFAWYGAKMWNLLPVETRELTNPESFKVAMKRYIWDNIPSYQRRMKLRKIEMTKAKPVQSQQSSQFDK